MYSVRVVTCSFRRSLGLVLWLAWVTNLLLEMLYFCVLILAGNSMSLFPVYQSSYRRGHSTETAVLCVHNDLVRAVDEKHIAALVLLDLSAAFDTVDYDLKKNSLHKKL